MRRHPVITGVCVVVFSIWVIGSNHSSSHHSSASAASSNPSYSVAEQNVLTALQGGAAGAVMAINANGDPAGTIGTAHDFCTSLNDGVDDVTAAEAYAYGSDGTVTDVDAGTFEGIAIAQLCPSEKSLLQ